MAEFAAAGVVVPTIRSVIRPQVYRYLSYNYLFRVMLDYLGILHMMPDNNLDMKK